MTTSDPERPAHEAVRGVLGVPVRFEADRPALLDVVARCYGGPAAAAASAARPCVRLSSAGPAARGDDGAAPGPAPGRADRPGSARLPAPSADGRRLALRWPGCTASADADRLEAVAKISPARLRDERRFGEILDTLTLFLVTRVDRQPVHAAVVALDGRALLFAGPSGAGKSTLAYTLHRAGFRVLDDDAAYIQLDPRPRVWGTARRLHLPPDAGTRFPELAGRRPVLRANGKRKLAVDLEHAGDAAPAAAEPAGLCLLERGATETALEPVAPEDAVAAVLRRLDPGFDAFRDTLPARLRAVAAAGAWRLRLSTEPDAAVAIVRRLLGPDPG